MSTDPVPLFPDTGDIAACLRRQAIEIENPKSEGDVTVSAMVISRLEDGRIMLKGFGDIDDMDMLAQLQLAQTRLAFDVLGIKPPEAHQGTAP